MKHLLSTNIYEPAGTVLIVGTCLPQMQPESFSRLEAMADEVYTLCLEESHINTAVTKLGAILSTGRVQKLIFASVDRSPHCTQLHYIHHELKRMLPELPPIEHFVAADETLFPVSEEAIERSKTLRLL